MKYLEELNNGECFEFQNNCFIITHDFKKNGDRSCIKLNDGSNNWLKPDTIVKIADIFTMDKDNNIIAIKERLKEDVSNKTKDIS